MRHVLRLAAFTCAATLQTWACVAHAAGADPQSASNQVQVPPAQAQQIGKGEEFQRQSATGTGQHDRLRQRSSGIADAGNSDSRASSESKAGLAETKAIDHISSVVRDAIALRKTLIVWLVEQSAEAAPLSRNMADHICGMLEDLSAGGASPQMAVIGYGGEANFLVPEPTSDIQKLRSALSALSSKNRTPAEEVRTFSAVNKAIEKYLPYRKMGFEVIFVLAGASSGSDLPRADEAVAALKRSAVPVFGLGPAVPFANSPSNGSTRPVTSAEATRLGKQSTESLFPERIQLELVDRDADENLTDSGYGPFGLERICRQTGGRFFRIRVGSNGGWELDPATGDVKPELLAKYAPDYVNDDQYKQLLAQNKCRLALHNAAQLPPTAGLDPNVRTSFPKEKDEATLSKGITVAQRAAAERDQPLQHLYDALVAGEADRPNLTGARWQAEYDLAMGQVLAAKARLDGYNTILAVLKQGKSFSNPASKRWVLEPADELSASSALDKMVKSSRTCLQRVVTEHPGTPWAVIAEDELRHPAGWKLIEDSQEDANSIRPKRNAKR